MLESVPDASMRPKVAARSHLPVVHLAGELDSSCLPALSRALAPSPEFADAYRPATQCLLLDLSRVTLCAVAAARAVHQASENLRANGVRLEILVTDETVRQVLEMARLGAACAPAGHESESPGSAARAGRLADVLVQAMRATDADDGDAHYLDRENHALHLIRCIGYDEHFAAHLETVHELPAARPAGRPAGRRAGRGRIVDCTEPVFIDDLASSTALPEGPDRDLLLASGVQSCAFIPVSGPAGDALGVVCVHRPKPGTWSTTHRDRLLRLAGAVSEGDDQPPPEPATTSPWREQRQQILALLQRMAELPEDGAERARLREIVIRNHMNYARHLARRYGRGHEDAEEDFAQVAYLGLVKAVDQYDPRLGTPFLGYATPVILGEIKRHFRDSTWAVHVPRRMQELSGAMYKAKDDLRTELGREPTLSELADRLNVEVDEVVSALDAADAYRTSSLDRPVGMDESSASLGELIGHDDPGYDHALHHETLRTLMAKLSDRDKRIVLMRFFRGMTQSEIGEKMGTSQMQISRILSKIIGQLREGFFDEA